MLGPWRIPTEAAHSLRELLHAEAAETTVVLPPGETLTDTVSEGSGRPPSERTADTPSGVSERLSEGVRDSREKAEALLEELQRLEGRPEAAEIQKIALRDALTYAVL